MSAILTTRSNFPTLLTDVLHLAFGNWNTWDNLYGRIYKTYHSDKAMEYEMEMQGGEMGEIQQEGSPGTATTIRQRYMTTYWHQYYSQSIKISRAAIKDNRQASKLPSYVEQLKSGLETTKNLNAMFLFNNAFTNASVGGDGQPMCSTQHPINGGTLANTFTNGVQLNESSLEDAITIMRSWKNAAGLPIQVNAKKLLVPPAREFDAYRILGNPDRSGTANRDIGVINRKNYIPDGIISNPFIVSPKSWFLITDELNGFKHFVREELFFDDQGDVDSLNYTIKAIERYSMYFSNFRAVFGSAGV